MTERIKHIAVIVTTTEGNTYQVALTDEQCEALAADLQNLYFPENKIKVLSTKLHGVEIIENQKINLNEKRP